MSLHLFHPYLKQTAQQIVSQCDTCQRQKQVLQGHGQTAPCKAHTHPWRDVAVDLIGPWTLSINNQKVQFTALTAIDTVTGLVKLQSLENKTSAHVARQFENCCLSRYPRPLNCIHNQGGEFTGYSFQQLLHRHNIHSCAITAKNPQANAICERMHRTVGNSLQAMVAMNPLDGINTANQLVDCYLANCMFATRTAIYGSIKASPGKPH